MKRQLDPLQAIPHPLSSLSTYGPGLAQPREKTVEPTSSYELEHRWTKGPGVVSRQSNDKGPGVVKDL